MAQPAIQVVGMRELRRDLRRVGDRDLNDALIRLNRDLAREITNRALPLVPVRTGALQASVRSSGNLSGAIGRAGRASVPYAAAVHWGRSRGNVQFRHGRFSRGQGSVLARPFLWLAAQTIERNVVDRYRQGINRVLDTVRGYH